VRDEDGLSPRNRGLLLLVGSSVCVLLNLVSLRGTGRYYVMLFPFAGAMSALGLFLLVTGTTVEELRDRERRAPVRAMFGIMALGVVLGLLANGLVGD